MAAIFFLRSPVPMKSFRAFYGACEATDVSESTFNAVIGIRDMHMNLNY